jgi:biopolymer transport protein ExbD
MKPSTGFLSHQPPNLSPPEEDELMMDINTTPPPKPPQIVRIDIDANSVISWNGQALADRAALQAQLAQAASLQPQPELHIRSHPQAKYEAATAVLAGAQRQGLNKLGILGTEKFVN